MLENKASFAGYLMISRFMLAISHMLMTSVGAFSLHSAVRTTLRGLCPNTALAEGCLGSPIAPGEMLRGIDRTA